MVKLILSSHLSGYLVRPDWMLKRPLPEPKECPDKGQRDRDSEPEGQKCNQGEEGDRRRRVFVPQHQIHDEKVREDDARMIIKFQAKIVSSLNCQPLD